MKRLSKRAAALVKISKLADLSLDTAITNAADQIIRHGIGLYSDEASIVGFLEKSDAALKAWPDILAGSAQLWKIKWNNGKFQREQYPTSLKNLIFGLATIHIGGCIKQACFPARKDKALLSSMMVKTLTLLVIQIAPPTEGGVVAVVDYMVKLRDLIGVYNILSPSQPAGEFVRILDFYCNSESSTVDNGIYSLVMILCTFISAATGQQRFEGDLERIHAQIFDLIYDFDVPSSECSSTGVHSLLSRLIIASTRNHHSENVVQQRLITRYQETGSRNANKKILRPLVDNWQQTWDGVRAFHTAAPYLLAGVFAFHTAAPYLLAGVFGQWNHSSRGVRNGVFGNIETLLPIPPRGAQHIRSLMVAYPSEPFPLASWTPVDEHSEDGTSKS
ncbi:hypothetical protein DFS34DRAFT_606353 [Phlyctochytrium arcticum]|nr:hypothetical protein DFS34DRAFT_606353 [Phlyctochytrium arcticum]